MPDHQENKADPFTTTFAAAWMLVTLAVPAFGAEPPAGAPAKGAAPNQAARTNDADPFLFRLPSGWRNYSRPTTLTFTSPGRGTGLATNSPGLISGKIEVLWRSNEIVSPMLYNGNKPNVTFKYWFRPPAGTNGTSSDIKQATIEFVLRRAAEDVLPVFTVGHGLYAQSYQSLAGFFQMLASDSVLRSMGDLRMPDLMRDWNNSQWVVSATFAPFLSEHNGVPIAAQLDREDPKVMHLIYMNQMHAPPKLAPK